MAAHICLWRMRAVFIDNNTKGRHTCSALPVLIADRGLSREPQIEGPIMVKIGVLP